MEDQQYPEGHEKELTTKINAVESRGCGMFDFLGQKEEKPQEDRNAAMTDCDAAQVTKCKEKKQEKPTLVEELHRSRCSSSSSSDEGGEKKKKGLMEKMKEKVSCQGEEQVTEVPVEKCDEMVNAEPTHPEEKKGILEKIKEKLPGQHKKEEECAPSTPPECAPDGHSPEGETKEKKGILDKIKEKLPGYHKNGEEEKKEN